ncbi:amino acid adenylation domain-containing protein [Nonomuraea sp. NPDC055795]
MTPESIGQAYSSQVSRAQDAIAVRMGDLQVSYRQLDIQANRVAHRLMELGIGREDPVTVLMRRSPDLVAALIGILKAGACYAPLHDAYPRERRQRAVDRLGSRVLVTDRASYGADAPVTRDVLFAGELAGAREGDPGVDVAAGQLAYVMFTSGSTGEPKGVAVTHANVLQLVLDPCWEGGHHERVLMLAPHAFDVSTYELWVPLLRGGTVVLAPADNFDATMLPAQLAGGRVTAVHLTAGLFRVVAEEAPEVFAAVREVMTGGDVVSAPAVRRVLEACPGVVVRAMYGPTETTLFATHHVMRAAGEVGATVPIGRPIAAARVYVLGQGLRPVPDGELGEMYIGGPGVARGYLGDPVQTQERFLPDPFAGDGARMYRTGDLARRLPSGALDFAGRTDDQIKVRGFRVEPAEVAAAIAGHPGVLDVAVVVRTTPSGERQLVAHVVSGRPGLDLGEVREHAAGLLPAYMIPAAFALVSALPLTPNGKVDVKALLDSEPHHEEKVP